MANDRREPSAVYLDAYTPPEMALRAEKIGVAKAQLPFVSTFLLAVLAGAFIALGAAFYVTAVTGLTVGLGLTRLLGGVAFSLGLIMVVLSGAELFTGNTLVIVAAISGKVRFLRLMHNWAVVYLGNLVGSVATAALVYGAGQWKMGDLAVGVSAYQVAGIKLGLSFGTAFCSGILCNALVCMAVWLCYSGRSSTDKILAIVFPITAFVAMGFEHSVANMYLIPYGMMLARTPEFLSAASGLSADPALFDTGRFLLGNLLPVTLGNIVGGALMVGSVYWVVFIRGQQDQPDTATAPEDP